MERRALALLQGACTAGHALACLAGGRWLLRLAAPCDNPWHIPAYHPNWFAPGTHPGNRTRRRLEREGLRFLQGGCSRRDRECCDTLRRFRSRQDVAPTVGEPPNMHLGL
jgi:hypothetical protein